MKTNKRGPQPQNFYSWVRRRVVREDAARFLLTIDGKERIVPVHRGKGGVASVRPMVRTIEQLKPELVEAHNKAGEVLGVWEMPENAEPEPPGYAPEAGDSEPQRDLKVVAHLIADAYKTALGGLENVIRIQNETFANERKGMGATVQGIERLLGKLQRARIRVATAADAAAAAGAADVEDPDEWLRDFVGTVIAHKMGVPMGGMANGAHEEAAGEPEGGDDAG
jgi:hypothetical protein